ncbi:hypothetical protein FJZ33_09480 [Candidatus Poribacteria bacterium]|nr:hypothetical protein [Candidatus Poribacteria bacterium]
MVTRNLLKDEIDKVNDRYLEILYRIIKAFENPQDAGRFNITDSLATSSWEKFIKETYGCLSDDPIERSEQGQYEIREAIR